MKVVFSGDFESGSIVVGPSPVDQWIYDRQDGGKSRIVPITSLFSDSALQVDGSGKPRGNVMKITMEGPAVAHPDWGSDTRGLWRAIYPAWQNGVPPQTLSAPCAVQVDIMMSKGLGGGFLGVHRLNIETDDRTSVAAYEIEPNGKIKLLARDGKGNDKRVYLQDGLFKIGAWNTLRLEFLPDGSVMPYVNGRLAYRQMSDLLKVPVDDAHDAGFVDAHAGFILGGIGGGNDDVPKGAWLLNDNFIILRHD